jgi:hypothetical protein
MLNNIGIPVGYRAGQSLIIVIFEMASIFVFGMIKIDGKKMNN